MWKKVCFVWWLEWWLPVPTFFLTGNGSIFFHQDVRKTHGGAKDFGSDCRKGQALLPITQQALTELPRDAQQPKPVPRSALRARYGYELGNAFQDHVCAFWRVMFVLLVLTAELLPAWLVQCGFVPLERLLRLVMGRVSP